MVKQVQQSVQQRETAPKTSSGDSGIDAGAEPRQRDSNQGTVETQCAHLQRGVGLTSVSTAGDCGKDDELKG